MFNKHLSAAPALILISLFGVSAANAANPPCYNLASLQGQYAIIGTYGANVAMAIGTTRGSSTIQPTSLAPRSRSSRRSNS